MQKSYSRQPLWMLAAALMFAVMGACVKFASQHFHAMELVMYRGVVGMLVTFALAKAVGLPLTTQYPGMHAWRGAVGAVSLVTWFYALAYLPLATAMMLNYMSSVWIATFLVGGALMYGKPAAQGALLATVLAGFGGVVMMMRPAFDAQMLWPGLIGMISGMTAALAYLQVTALGRAGEPELRIVYYFAGASVVMGWVGTMTGFLGKGFSNLLQWPALWIVPIGILASAGQLCMTRAYASGATMLVANLQYSGIVFAAILGMIVFGDQLPLIAWAGMAVIVASGIAATVLRNRAMPNTPPEEH
jgi:S-adenosylmethionine uptake transporter